MRPIPQALALADTLAAEFSDPRTAWNAAPPGGRAWPQSLAGGAVGIALLHIERAHCGRGDWATVHTWLASAAHGDLTAAANASLYMGAPALAFAMNAAAGDSSRYQRALKKLDDATITVTRRRLAQAHARPDAARRPRPVVTHRPREPGPAQTRRRHREAGAVVAVPGSVLAVMAHPDDLELWAGGTLALHARHAPVIGAVPAHDPLRDAEAQAGAKALGIDVELHPELDPATVGSLIRRHRPDVLIPHSVDDVHPDPRAAAAAVLAALPQAHIATGFPHRLYTCDSYNSLTLNGPVTASVIIDITATFEQKMRALAEHRSQPINEHFGPMAENLSALWGARIGTPRAEAFRPLPILGRLPAIAHL